MSMSKSLAAAACAVALAVACSDDEPVGGSSTGGTGGSGGATGGAAGSGGAGTGGTGGSAGSGGSAGQPAAVARLLVAGTDFATSTEIASIDLGTQAVLGRVTVSDGDAVPAASAGLGFVLERTLAKLDLLNASGDIEKSIDVGKTAVGLGGTGSTNPVSVVAFPGDADASTAGRAYVFLHDVNRVAVVDLAQGSVQKSIDLASYLVSGDGDGSVDMLGAVRALGGRVIFVLARIDRTTIAAPSFQLACPSAKALVLALDPATDTVVAPSGGDAGLTLELGLANPVDVALDGTKLHVLSAGCFASSDGGAQRVKHGIETVDLVTGSVSTALAPANEDYLARLLLLSSNSAVIDSFDATYAEHWFAWKPGTASLGSELSAVPMAPSVEGATSLLGVTVKTSDAGTSAEVVRYDTATQKATLVVANPWQGSFSSAAGSALVN